MKQKLKNEKGITLVALVITIIVLLILAGVTLSMVMGESGIFGKANSAKEKTQLSNAEETIKLAVLENKVNSVSGDVALTNDQLKEEIAKKLTEQGYTVSGSKVTYYEDKTIDIEDYLEKESTSKITWTWADTDNSGTKNVGDVVTDSTGEKFYIMSTEGDKYALLAEKNIDTTTMKQSDSANIIAFSSTNYWSSIEGITYPYNLNNTATSTDTDAIAIAKAYGTAKGVEGRLMTVEEVVALGGDKEKYSTMNCPSWINLSAFWLGSASEADSAWSVYGYYGYSLGYNNFSNTNNWGVRPVIEISKDLIK